MKPLFFFLMLWVSLASANVVPQIQPKQTVQNGPVIVVTGEPAILRVSPNPSEETSTFTLTSTELSIESIKVFDTQNVLVFEQHCEGSTCSADFSNLSEGTYVLTIKVSGTTYACTLNISSN